MAAIDLTHIIYRAHQIGDSDDSKNIPNQASGTSRISLAGIKYRSKQIGDVEEE